VPELAQGPDPLPISFDKALAIQGWMTERELAFLYSLGLSVGDGATVVEVGCWKGRSSVAICEALREKLDVSFYAVDTFSGDEHNPAMHQRHGEELGADRVYAQFQENTADYSFVHIVREPSADASHAFIDGSIDWLFIDAEHTFDHVRSDVQRWYPKVKPGGIISGHDYQHFEVQRAVDTHLSDVEVWESIWYLHKLRDDLGFRIRPFVEGKARSLLRTTPAAERQLRRLRSVARPD
jgi:predicted O-methyltransferase YrrM